MKKRITIGSLLFLGFIQNGIAQNTSKTKFLKNNIQLQMDRFYFSKSTDRTAYTLKTNYAGSGGISYMRQLHPNLSVRVGYNGIWKTSRLRRAGTLEVGTDDTNNIGKIHSRGKWQFVDLEFNYSKIWRQHRFSVSFGATFTQTKNEYIDNISAIYYPSSPPHVLSVNFYYKTEQYWGGLAGLHYDYLFWENRIAAGADFKLRFYKDVPFSYSVYGIHVGYNF